LIVARLRYEIKKRGRALSSRRRYKAACAATRQTNTSKEQQMTDSLSIRRDTAKGKIYSHVRRKWLVETPEETVRQEYLLVLVNEYGFVLEQIAEELELTGRGSASARADFVIWRTAHDKAADNAPFIIVECKSDSVTIKPQDYSQGENYARICGAPFFVTHNSRETRYWRVKKDKLPGYTEEIENIPHGGASDKDIEELLAKLRTFKEKEFADLLHQCHNVIRNREKKDPAAAFDEIAKVLFIKVYVERQLLSRRSRENLFTVDVLNRQIAENPLDTLFQQTKLAYAADKIFEADERINLKPATGEEIVRKLEKYNLSDTSEDVKGVAFERFLGRTFRGEIGQFFTPRTIVEFMVHMIDPQEGEIVCDPASGSGGFLIRVFEIVREKILAAADQEYSVFKAETEADSSLTPELRAKLLQSKFSELRAAVDPQRKDSRLWKLSNRCIYGTDANDRMARTSKMNMIMHGDGHGGVHHHDGFLNVNGIFEGRFDIILTNPPFGANVEPSDKVLEADLAVSPEAERRYQEEYGDLYRDAQNRVKAALNKPIASLFDLPKSDKAKIKTEVLFIERCLDLLKPGGRLAIVLPEGIFNNPSLAYVREFVENRAFIRAVVSLPQETFVSSGASVKCSLLFLQKFNEAEQRRFDATAAAVKAEAAARGAEEAAAEQARLEAEIAAAKQAKDADRRKALQKELKDFLSQAEERQAAEARRMLKERLDYPVFMYEAEKVGISATGEEEQNELYPNANQPAGCEKTCLEWYREFKANPWSFIEEAANAAS
jgi:type I restriction enzyme M protein